MNSMIIDGSYRRKKYPTKVDVDSRKKDKGGEITVIKDKSQRPRNINGILIVVSGSKTSIEPSNQKLINPILGILKREQGKFPWKGIHQQSKKSKITVRIRLKDPEIEDLKNLIRSKIRL